MSDESSRGLSLTIVFLAVVLVVAVVAAYIWKSQSRDHATPTVVAGSTEAAPCAPEVGNPPPINNDAILLSARKALAEGRYAVACAHACTALRANPTDEAAEGIIYQTLEKMPVYGQEGLEQRLSQKVSFDFADTSISDVTQFFQSLIGMPIIVSPQVLSAVKTVTLKGKNATVEDALGCIRPGNNERQRTEVRWERKEKEKEEDEDGLSWGNEEGEEDSNMYEEGDEIGMMGSSPFWSSMVVCGDGAAFWLTEEEWEERWGSRLHDDLEIGVSVPGLEAPMTGLLLHPRPGLSSSVTGACSNDDGEWVVLRGFAYQWMTPPYNAPEGARSTQTEAPKWLPDLHKRLTTAATFNFNEVPLTNAAEFLQKETGATFIVDDSAKKVRPNVRIDREKMATMGVPMTNVAQALDSLANRNDAAALAALKVDSSNGKVCLLKDVATITAASKNFTLKLKDTHLGRVLGWLGMACDAKCVLSDGAIVIGKSEALEQRKEDIYEVIPAEIDVVGRPTASGFIYRNLKKGIFFVMAADAEGSELQLSGYECGRPQAEEAEEETKGRAETDIQKKTKTGENAQTGQDVEPKEAEQSVEAEK